jgi:hypothetical protein
MAERCCGVEMWSEGMLSRIVCVIEAVSVRLDKERVELRVVISGIVEEGVIHFGPFLEFCDFVIDMCRPWEKSQTFQRALWVMV